MIFTPLVKNKLASLLALLQSGRSTGNHSGWRERGRERTMKHLESLLFPSRDQWRRGNSEGSRGKQATAQVVISKLVK